LIRLRFAGDERDDGGDDDDDDAILTVHEDTK
jgi:hypothetical protein